MLSVTAEGGDVQVMSPLESPAGFLTSLSAAGRSRSRCPARYRSNLSSFS